MSAINQLISRLSEVHSLSEELKTAEKAKVFSLKQKATSLFKVLSSLIRCN
jgi:hypothetical protein